MPLFIFLMSIWTRMEEFAKNFQDILVSIQKAIVDIEVRSYNYEEKAKKTYQDTEKYVTEIDNFILEGFQQPDLDQEKQARLVQFMVSYKPQLEVYREQLNSYIATPPPKFDFAYHEDEKDEENKESNTETTQDKAEESENEEEGDVEEENKEGEGAKSEETKQETTEQNPTPETPEESKPSDNNDTEAKNISENLGIPEDELKALPELSEEDDADENQAKNSLRELADSME